MASSMALAISSTRSSGVPILALASSSSCPACINHDSETAASGNASRLPVDRDKHAWSGLSMRVVHLLVSSRSVYTSHCVVAGLRKVVFDTGGLRKVQVGLPKQPYDKTQAASNADVPTVQLWFLPKNQEHWLLREQPQKTQGRLRSFDRLCCYAKMWCRTEIAKLPALTSS